jgi:hypothetical protein
MLKKKQKTEWINMHLVDYTTGMDIIKRPANNKLPEESLDKSDRRAKLLAITNDGKRLLEQPGKKISNEIQMFLE